MVKVTLLSGGIFLKILLFNGCDRPKQTNREEIRYENKLDSQYERKIDSAYARIGRDCDSTLQARWKEISDSILQTHHVRDSVEREASDRLSQFRAMVAREEQEWASGHPDSTAIDSAAAIPAVAHPSPAPSAPSKGSHHKHHSHH